MGIPAERFVRIMYPKSEDIYRIMRNHLLLFRERWFSWIFEEEKPDYLATRKVQVTEENIISSFTYIENLPEVPDKNCILDLAKSVKSGILAYSYQDQVNEGFEMGVHADYLLKKLTYENVRNHISRSIGG
jgi:hypothetical protein